MAVDDAIAVEAFCRPDRHLRHEPADPARHHSHRDVRENGNCHIPCDHDNWMTADSKVGVEHIAPVHGASYPAARSSRTSSANAQSPISDSSWGNSA